MSLCVSRWQLKGCYSVFLSAVLSSWYPTHIGSLSTRVSVTLLDARPFLRVHVWHRTIHTCHCQVQAWEEVNSWNCYTFLSGLEEIEYIQLSVAYRLLCLYINSERVQSLQLERVLLWIHSFFYLFNSKSMAINEKLLLPHSFHSSGKTFK